MVKALKDKGVKMVPFELKYSLSTVQFTLRITTEVDTLTHFDHWQRAGLDEDYEVQNAWPVVVRRSRLISAVDYLQVLGGYAQVSHLLDFFVDRRGLLIFH